jgi:TPR repeat protein
MKIRELPQDMVKAAEWYSRSSDAGNVRATANLAMMYAKGQGVEQDLHRAEMLFDEAEYVGLDCGKARASVGL